MVHSDGIIMGSTGGEAFPAHAVPAQPHTPQPVFAKTFTGIYFGIILASTHTCILGDSLHSSICKTLTALCLININLIRKEEKISKGSGFLLSCRGSAVIPFSFGNINQHKTNY